MRVQSEVAVRVTMNGDEARDVFEVLAAGIDASQEEVAPAGAVTLLAGIAEALGIQPEPEGRPEAEESRPPRRRRQPEAPPQRPLAREG